MSLARLKLLSLVFLYHGLSVVSVENLKLGSAINVFERFGYLHISMRVVPRNESGWIFREPSVEIFQDIDELSIAKRASDGHGFGGNFEIAFCDNIRELFKTYFQDFYIERLDEPWEAFLDYFSNETLAYNLGINASYVTTEHCYVLVRITRPTERVFFSPEFEPYNTTIIDNVIEKAQSVLEEDSPSVWSFVKTYGSHYISSYATGNSMYQVIVYSPKTYTKLKDKVTSSGILQALGTSEIKAMFSPQYAEQMGLILTSSGNASLAGWAESTLLSSYTEDAEEPPTQVTYPNLLKLYKNSKLLKELKNLLGNEALLHLNLKTVEPVFKDERIRNWFVEILDNNLKLWEVN